MKFGIYILIIGLAFAALLPWVAQTIWVSIFVGLFILAGIIIIVLEYQEEDEELSEDEEDAYEYLTYRLANVTLDRKVAFVNEIKAAISDGRNTSIEISEMLKTTSVKKLTSKLRKGNT